MQAWTFHVSRFWFHVSGRVVLPARPVSHVSKRLSEFCNPTSAFSGTVFTFLRHAAPVARERTPALRARPRRQEPARPNRAVARFPPEARNEKLETRNDKRSSATKELIDFPAALGIRLLIP